MLVELELSLFAIGGTRDYGSRVAQHLDLVLGEHEERGFEDGEHESRPLLNVRHHVFVIPERQALSPALDSTGPAGPQRIAGPENRKIGVDQAG